MLSSVTVSSVSHAHSLTHSTGLNRVYRIRAKNDDNAHRHHKVSTKILGFGVFMIGVVVLAIGLIMGIEFPTHIKEKIIKDNCILNKEHEFYEKWTRDKAYARHNRIYYWEITNPEEFLAGATPTFVEKGPYVYREKQTRLNVRFKDNLISYRIMFTQTFSESLTRAECGSTCTETDEITTINTEFVRKLYAYGGWTGYLKAYLPKYIDLLTNWTSTQPLTNQHLVDFLSCAKSSCINSTLEYTNTNSPLYDVSLGYYVLQNDTVYKDIVLHSSAFINDSGYLPGYIVQTLYDHSTITVQGSNLNHCSIEEPSTSVFWKVKVNRLLNTTLPSVFFMNSTIDTTECVVYFSQKCNFSDAMLVLTDHVVQFSNWTSAPWTLNVCDARTRICDTLQETHGTIDAFLRTLNDFVDNHLLRAVSDTVLPLHQNSIIATRPQHELAKGYIRRVSHSADPYEEDRETGILDHQWTIAETFRNSPEVVVGTCLYEENIDNNMVVKKYNGSHFTKTRDHIHDNRQLSGNLVDFPPSHLCRACTDPNPASLVYDVFLRELHRSVKFEYTGEINKYDNLLYSYKMTKDALHGDNSCDLINTTSFHGYTSFVGRPVFDGSRCEYLTRNLNSRFTHLNSEIELEPRTGKAWFQSIKLQTSTLILQNHMEGVNGRIHSGISGITTPLPLHWVDRRVEIVESEIDYFEYRIDRLMAVSCGGLIGFVTLSIMIMVFSVFVGMLSTRKNKVHAMPEEPGFAHRG